MMFLDAGAITPSTLWRDWRPDTGPMVALVLTAAVYARGVRRVWKQAGHGRGVSERQVAFFAAAMLSIAIVLVSPLDAMAEVLFSAHMTQHVVLAVIVPPLILLGAPLPALLWAMPAEPRIRIVRAVRSQHWLVGGWRWITAPALAWLIHGAAIWAWHAPRLYELALRNDTVHALEHLSFVGTGILLWWGILHGREARRTAYAIGIITVFFTAMHTGVLGALITLSHRLWYPAQASGAAAWGLTPMQDQQLAGLIMWVPGGLLYVIAMSALFVGWLEPERAHRHRVARHIAVAPANPDEQPEAGAPALATVRVVAIAFLLCAVGGAASCRDAPSVVPGGSVARGKATITALGCGSCHTIAGIPGARGLVGPPLTGVGNRSILAGELANTPENMMHWVEDPPSVEPNTDMPNLGVTPAQARDIAAYLYTLR